MDIKPYLDHTNQLYSLYKDLNLLSIDDFHGENEERWNDTNFMSYFIDITRSVNLIHPFIDSDFKMYDDFVLLSGDIKFCAGMLNYLYPHVTTRHNEISSNLIDRRYIMHISFGYQSIYQFWDRIGDLLWHFFKTGLGKDSVFTGRVLTNLPSLYKETSPYISLKALFDEFKEHFDVRHDVVHSFTLGTEIYWKRNSAYGDSDMQQELIDKMKYYRDAITESLPSCINALDLALQLILEINRLGQVVLTDG